MKVSESLKEIIRQSSPGPWYCGGGYPQRVVNSQAVVIAEVFSDPDTPSGDGDLIALSRSLFTWAMGVSEELEEFTSAPVSAFHQLSLRGRSHEMLIELGEIIYSHTSIEGTLK